MEFILFHPITSICVIIGCWVLAFLVMYAPKQRRTNAWHRTTSIVKIAIATLLVVAPYGHWWLGYQWATSTYEYATVKVEVQELAPLQDSLEPDAPNQSYLVEQQTDQGEKQYAYMVQQQDGYQVQTRPADHVEMMIDSTRVPRYIQYDTSWVDERGSFYGEPPAPEHERVIYVPTNGVITNDQVSLDF